MLMLTMNSRVTIRSAGTSAKAFRVHWKTGMWLCDRVVVAKVGDGMRAVDTLLSFATMHVKNHSIDENDRYNLTGRQRSYSGHQLDHLHQHVPSSLRSRMDQSGAADAP